MSPRLNVAVKPSSSCRHLSTVLPWDSDSWRSAVEIPLLVSGPLHVQAAVPSVCARRMCTRPSSDESGSPRAGGGVQNARRSARPGYFAIMGSVPEFFTAAKPSVVRASRFGKFFFFLVVYLC